MTPKEVKALVKALRAAGVTHYKTPELELNLTTESVVSRGGGPKKTATPVETMPEDVQEIKHKVEEFASLLKLSDTDLVDRLFPDHTDQSDEEATA